MTEVHDSPRGWVRHHIDDYLRTEGQKGHRWRGAPCLLLTTRGRKTGKLRRTALIYGVADERYLLVASHGGAAHNPEWYLNLSADPEVEVQVGADIFRARARTATDEEKPALWGQMASIWPEYDQYQERTERVIPLVILERE